MVSGIRHLLLALKLAPDTGERPDTVGAFGWLGMLGVEREHFQHLSDLGFQLE